MTPLKLPKGLKATQLKHTAFLLGLHSTGTKPGLEQTILHRLTTPPLLSNPTRIVSVDMGIKNLGLCVLDLTPTPSTLNKPTTSKLKIHDWKKIDLLAQTPTFQPSSLAHTAVRMTRHLLATYEPTHVLLERQRFRSGGGAAVQEWTLRVNMLESMIWACLETLRTSSSVGRLPAVEEVSPARVARFWCLGSPTLVFGDLFGEGWRGLEVGEGKGRKVEKGDKIRVVRSWLSRGRDEGGEGVELEVGEGARGVVDGFVAETKGRGRNGEGKLDDLADCLLQGAAWVRWEENRQRILRILGR